MAPETTELSALCRLADSKIDGGLAAFLRTGRENGRSWDWLARELYLRTNREIDVSGPTVRVWARILLSGEAA